MGTVFNILDFGAKGDGATLDTAAIQNAVSAAVKAGGGTVLFPAGRVYRAGYVKLESHVTLFLEPNAVLKSSDNLADYYEDKERSSKGEGLSYYFIYALNVEDIAIEGSGTVDCNGSAFWSKTYESGQTDETKPKERHPLADDRWYRLKDKNQWKRPVTVYMRDCSGIRIENITIRNGAAFTVWSVNCERILYHGITIRNSRGGPNTDGFDIDCCRIVRISDCDIETGDDCIALKSTKRPGAKWGCQDITVMNCVLSSMACAVRVGYEGDAPLHDCVFANLVIYDSRAGLDIVSIAPQGSNWIVHGAPIDRISFQNVVMHNVGFPIYVWAGDQNPKKDKYSGHIRDIVFSNISADGFATSYIAGEFKGAIRNVTLRDVTLRLHDNGSEFNNNPTTSCWYGYRTAGVLRVFGAENVVIENFRSSTERKQPALAWQDTVGLEYKGKALPEAGEL